MRSFVLAIASATLLSSSAPAASILGAGPQGGPQPTTTQNSTAPPRAAPSNPQGPVDEWRRTQSFLRYMDQHKQQADIQRELQQATDDADAARDRRKQGLDNIQRILDIIHGTNQKL